MRQSKTYYKINEVAEILKVPASTLRWWESEIESFNPTRSPGGQRCYTATDLEMARKIKTLLHKRGMSVKAAAAILKESAPLNYYPYCGNPEEAIRLLNRLSEFVSDNPKAKMLISAIEKYLRRTLHK